MSTTTSTTATSADIPEILQPYFTGAGTPGQAGYVPGLLPTAQGVYGRSYATTYQPLADAGLMGAGRVAGLSPAQMELGRQISGMQTPGEFGSAYNYAQTGAQGLSSLMNTQASNVNAPNLQTFQMGPTATVSAPTLENYSMNAAQTGYNPNLQYFQMAAPQTFGESQLKQYMDPYAQNVTDVAKRKAVEDYQRTARQGNLDAVRKGGLGTSGALLAGAERERAIGNTLSDIQARGLEGAYQNAQSQFERDRAAQMGAASQNLQAQLGVQQLGTQTGLQTALANLNADQQARVQNLASQLQTQGLSASQALQAALANQSAIQDTAKQNLQAALGVQQLGAGQSLEAQKANQTAGLQAAANRLAAAQGLGTLAGTTASIGIGRQAADLDRLKMIGAYGDLERATAQQGLDARYADIMRQIGYPEDQIAKMSNVLRGVPMAGGTSTTSTTTPPPSFSSQLAGMGLSGLSLYNLAGKT